MKNKVAESRECASQGAIPEARFRKFASAVAGRKKKRDHAKACAKRKRKASHGR